MTISFLFREFVLTASDLRALGDEDELEDSCMSFGKEKTCILGIIPTHIGVDGVGCFQFM